MNRSISTAAFSCVRSETSAQESADTCVGNTKKVDRSPEFSAIFVAIALAQGFAGDIIGDLFMLENGDQVGDFETALALGFARYFCDFMSLQLRRL